ncbi:MAG: S41 family peptidase, partial [Oscillospiraceae bacterium]
DMFDITYKSKNTRNKKYDTAVLINGNSASASEVLAAALSENEVGILIGEQSYGKGTVQKVVGLDNNASMKYTMAYYLTPDGNNINKVGLAPYAIVKNDSVPIDASGFKEFEYLDVWERGESSPEIKTAKEILAVWGLYGGELDETFNAELERSIKAFQTSLGLFSYGVLDITTQINLFNQIKATTVVVDRQLEAGLSHYGL